ncbi:MAG: hypothetical protein ABIV21_07055, partial [Pyrinomonadaceae bacterium]
MDRFLLILLFLFVSIPSISIAQTRKASSPKDEPSNGVKETRSKVVWDKKVGLTTKDIVAGRNLALYDEGGYFDCGQKFGASMGLAELEKCDQSRIRDFAWNHWHNKVKGYVVFTLNSVDA